MNDMMRIEYSWRNNSWQVFGKDHSFLHFFCCYENEFEVKRVIALFQNKNDEKRNIPRKRTLTHIDDNGNGVFIECHKEQKQSEAIGDNKRSM